MSVAVVGAGLTGLALCWYLLEKDPSLTITLFDKDGVASGASGVAAGLLHPFASASGSLVWNGYNGYKNTKELLDIVQKSTKEKIYTHSGMLRPCATEKQFEEFFKACKKFPENHWLSPEEALKKAPHILPTYALFIPDAITIDCSAYLNALFQLLVTKGLLFQKKEIQSLEELDSFDRVIFAIGAGVQKNLMRLPFYRINKGHIVILSSKESTIPLNAGAYLVPGTTEHTLIAGTTYEKTWTTEDPTIETAWPAIQEKLLLYSPFYAQKKPIDCKAGFRVAAGNHKPIIAKNSEKVFTVTGMGSKGLLYHAITAQYLIDILFDNTENVPKDIFYDFSRSL